MTDLQHYTAWQWLDIGQIVLAVSVLLVVVPKFLRSLSLHTKQLRSDRVHREAVDRARGELVIRLSDYRRAR